MIHSRLVHNHHNQVYRLSSELQAPTAACDGDRGGSTPAVRRSASCNSFPVATSKAHGDLYHRGNHGNTLGPLMTLSGIALSGVAMISSRTFADASIRFPMSDSFFSSADQIG